MTAPFKFHGQISLVRHLLELSIAPHLILRLSKTSLCLISFLIFHDDIRCDVGELCVCWQPPPSTTVFYPRPNSKPTQIQQHRILGPQTPHSGAINRPSKQVLLLVLPSDDAHRHGKAMCRVQGPDLHHTLGYFSRTLVTQAQMQITNPPSHLHLFLPRPATSHSPTNVHNLPGVCGRATCCEQCFHPSPWPTHKLLHKMGSPQGVHTSSEGAQENANPAPLSLRLTCQRRWPGSQPTARSQPTEFPC